MMFTVGLTGGIGSGKSTVADLFAEHGAAIVDTDAIAHRLTAIDGAAMPAIRAAFGAEVIAADGSLNRAAMRERVFADPAERIRLESILHPLIGTATREAAERVAAAHPYLIFVVPLLVESGQWIDRVDRVLVVDCEESVQIARVMARNGITRERIASIMRAQATRSQRRAAAHDVIDNSGTRETLLPAVAALHEKYCDLARAKALRAR